MKAILEFDLENFEDRKAHLRCVKSTEMAIILWEIQNNLRKKCIEKVGELIEYHPKMKNPEQYGIMVVLDRITELLEDNDININNLID